VWGGSGTPRPLFIPGKDPVPIVQKAGWTPGPVWTGAENLFATGIRSPNRLWGRNQVVIRPSTHEALQTSDIGMHTTEISTRSISVGDKGGRCVRLTIHHPVPLSWDLGTLTSWNPLDHCRPLTGLLYFYVTVHIQLSCVPNRPCCFRKFGIQRHFVWSIEQGAAVAYPGILFGSGSINSFEYRG